MKNENCNLHFTMFPSLQVNKTYASIVQNYKLQVYNFVNKKKIKIKIINHTLQSYKFTHYNITIFF